MAFCVCVSDCLRGLLSFHCHGFLLWHYFTFWCKPVSPLVPTKAHLILLMNERKLKFLVFPPDPQFLLKVLSGEEPMGKQNLASCLLLWKSDSNSRFSVTEDTQEIWTANFGLLHLHSPATLLSPNLIKGAALCIHNFCSIICIPFYIFCTSQGTSMSIWKGGGYHQIEKTSRRPQTGLAG